MRWTVSITTSMSSVFDRFKQTQGMSAIDPRSRNEFEKCGLAVRSQLYVILDVLSLLFFFRVLGQFGVWCGWFPFLPQFSQWQSGLMPYPALLALQFLILSAMLTLRLLGVKAVDQMIFSRNFKRPVGAAAMRVRSLRIFASLYALVMVLRCVYYLWARMQGEVFLGGWIPIALHFVLAGYVLVVAKILEQEVSQIESPEEHNEAVD